MSKKITHPLLPSLLLFPAGLLLLFPAGLPLLPWKFLGDLLPVSALILLIAHWALRLGPIAWPWRVCAFLPALLPVSALFTPFHHPALLFLAVLPWSVLILSLQRRHPTLPSSLGWALAFVLTLLLTAPPLQTLEGQPTQSLPVLIHNQHMIVLAALLVPVGLATRPFLRPLAANLLKTELFLLALPLLLAPPAWQITTSMKDLGETARHPKRWQPLPRLKINPAFDWQAQLPPTWQAYPDLLQLLRAWQQTSDVLSDRPVTRVFSGSDMPLPPDQMIRALQIHDFIQRDRYGYFVPESSFTRSVPPQMDPEATKWIERLRRHVTLTPRRLASHLNLPEQEARVLLRQLQELDLVRPLPASEERWRPAAAARKPLPGGWFPRMLLLITDAPPTSPWLSPSAYAHAHGLDIPTSESEIQHMIQAGLLQEVSGLHATAFRQLLQAAPVLRTTALHLTALLTALILACQLPLLQSSRMRILSLFLGIVCILPWQALPLLTLPLRSGLGLWLFRCALPERKSWHLRASLAAALLAWTALGPAILPFETPTEVQAAWNVLGLLPGLVLLTVLLRPLPPASEAADI